MKNGDMMFFFIIALAVAAMWAIMKRYPAVSSVNDSGSPLPSGMYTSGSLVNGMDVSRRVNFHQQPTGGPTTG